jgi:hypothetical protein
MLPRSLRWRKGGFEHVLHEAHESALHHALVRLDPHISQLLAYYLTVFTIVKPMPAEAVLRECWIGSMRHQALELLVDISLARSE